MTYDEALDEAKYIIESFDLGAVDIFGTEAEMALLGEAFGLMLNEIGDDETSRFVFKIDLEKLAEMTTNPAIHDMIQRSLLLLGQQPAEIHYIIKEGVVAST